MGDLWNGPTRAGSRGGKDKFKWDQIKDQSDREAYLGHSVMAPLGRWQKGRDLTWYTKENKSGSAVYVDAKGGKHISKTLEQEMAAEREAFRQREEDMRLESLGLKNRVNRLRGEMSDTDKKNLLLRNSGEAHENDDKLGHIGRVEGLGAAPVRKHIDLSDQLRLAQDAVSRGDIEGLVSAANVVVAAPERLAGLGPQLPPGFQTLAVVVNPKARKRAVKRAALLQKLQSKQSKLYEVKKMIVRRREVDADEDGDVKKTRGVKRERSGSSSS